MSVAHRRLHVARPSGSVNSIEAQTGFIGASAAACKVRETISQVAKSRATIFITGESGTGKEVCAQLIHDSSDRSDGPFVAVNCGAIPSDLMESELFGHLKGSFTGALSDRQGVALLACGGTLFLDEVCEMQLALQTKLLRFLQTSLVQRVGSGQQEPVDIRVVCATNRKPREEVASGRFRKDLFYRLQVIPLHLPLLANRGDDAAQLADHFLFLYSSEEQKVFNGFSPLARAKLQAYSWPGNVRELQNVVRRIVVLNSGPLVEAHMLPEEIRSSDASGCAGAWQAADNVVPFDDAGSNSNGCSWAGKPKELWQIERDAIESAILECSGSIPQAARMLGVSPSTIYRKKESWSTRI